MRIGRLVQRGAVAAGVALVFLLLRGASAHAADSGVTGFGTVSSLGAPGTVNQPLIALAATADGAGYWLIAGDGGVFSYHAPFYGSTGSMVLNSPVVGMAPTPTGRGYWMVASDGGVFAFGDAQFFGSMGGTPLNQPVVAIAATPTGRGYWLAAADGGVFAFGDAAFHGATPAGVGRVVSIVARPHRDGYWLVDDRGGVFAFGDAPFFGSAPASGIPISGRVTGATASSTGNGYALVASDGGVFAFGDATFAGTAPPPSGEVTVAIAAAGPGGYWTATTTGLVLAPAARGDSGPGVVAIQQQLIALGFWPGGSGGFYDDDTAQAVLAFQKYSGLPRTSVLDDTTARMLSNAPRAVPRSTTGDVVEVDKTRQILMIVRGGILRLVLNTSTGSQVPFSEIGLRSHKLVTGDAVTHEGVFHVYREVPDGWDPSDLGQLWRPKYFDGGIAVHGYLDVPAHPASHGCVRVSINAMNLIWATDLTPRGITVWVYH